MLEPAPRPGQIHAELPTTARAFPKLSHMPIMSNAAPDVPLGIRRRGRPKGSKSGRPAQGPTGTQHNPTSAQQHSETEPAQPNEQLCSQRRGRREARNRNPPATSRRGKTPSTVTNTAPSTSSSTSTTAKTHRVQRPARSTSQQTFNKVATRSAAARHTTEQPRPTRTEMHTSEAPALRRSQRLRKPPASRLLLLQRLVQREDDVENQQVSTGFLQPTCLHSGQILSRPLLCTQLSSIS